MTDKMYTYSDCFQLFCKLKHEIGIQNRWTLDVSV